VSAPAPVPFPPAAGELPPKKVAWLHPVELLRTGYNVWLSTTAKEYIDRRETLAALSNVKVSKDASPAAVFTRGYSVDAIYPDERHASGVRIDFVADVGDSWEATHSVATLLAKPELHLRGHNKPLQPADAVVLGGDLVYPTPSRDAYRRKMRSPFEGALPECANGKPPCLFAIPGNHDWYDGLTSFVREFCQGSTLGGWRMLQRRSYFAAKLTPGWWLWGIDIALDTRIDPPQQAYFLNVLTNTSGAEKFTPGDNIILCTAKPVWTESSQRPSEAYRNLNYFVSSIVAKHHGHVRVILAGDLHHYSRYENDGRDQLITAGGGGAYLTGTQHLPHRVAEVAADLTSRDQEAAPGAAAFRAAEYPYPSRPDSRRMALGALLLALRPANWPFVFFVMGALYVIFARNLLQAVPNIETKALYESLRLPISLLFDPDADVWLMVGIALGAGALVTASSERTAPRVATIGWGVFHGFLHLVLAVILLAYAVKWSVEVRILEVLPKFSELLPMSIADVVPMGVFYAIILVVGGILGATLVGTYFVVSDLLFGWHTNEVFAAQSIVNYRNFIRMHITADGKLMIYPIGLRTVPKKWRLRLNRKKGEPLYEPTDGLLTPHLIEGPIEITKF
jgi:hypothetical protein